jgi:hypothetical protein
LSIICFQFTHIPAYDENKEWSDNPGSVLLLSKDEEYSVFSVPEQGLGSGASTQASDFL